MLYLISPPFVTYKEFSDFNFFTKLEEALKTNEVDYFQLRMKDANLNKAEVVEIQKVAEQIKMICDNHKVPFILNDYVDLVKKVCADGLHMGLEDGDVFLARKIIGDDKILGVSCYNNFARAEESVKKTADYVAFGAFFPTTTKAARARPKLEIIKKWKKKYSHPVIAIGGINKNNIGKVMSAGPNSAAMISAVWFSDKTVTETIKEIKNNA